MNMRIKRMLLAFSVAVIVALAGCSNSSDGGGKESGGASEADLAATEVEVGIELLSSGDAAQSIEHFDKAIKYDKTNAKAWCAKGTAMRMQEKFEEAIELYSKAIELKPDYTICVDNLGVAYMYMSKFDQAVSTFNKALEIDPGYADAHFNMATLYLEGIGDKDMAAKHFEKFIQLSDKPEKVQEAKRILAGIK